MAKKNAVWGIDIGQVALKALRCTPGDDATTIVADKFDYIEFPKMLNQPEAEPEQMIRDALQQFLARNEVRGDKVSIAVPGQSGLSRFFRPPPVELHTLPDIVKYEVKQQIPFPIEDVIWDWQQLGGMSVDDRIVDAEVGLFAMKREAVFRALKPFDEAGVEVDLVQLSPLAVFNYVTHDVLENVPKPEDFDPENPPDSVVVISLGTDTTDLIVTNGIKLWLRNIPVGGNHFTKQLSRELKLTHAKAEQLKRNARQAEDPKQLFKAMRPVFNDLVNEIQRSLTFFQGIDKTARISKIVLLGNSANLPGLRQFLNQQLEMDIAKVSEFRHLTGAEVVREKAFDDNMLSFAPAYGLCLQGLNRGRLKTNLLPTEIQTQRIVRAKKPWVLAALSLMMLGMLAGYKYKQIANFRVDDNFTAEGGIDWKRAKSESTSKVNLSRDYMEKDSAQKALLEKINLLNRELTSASENKATWIEFNSALYQALPKDPRISGTEPVDPNEIPFEDREIIYVDWMETKFEKKLEDWYAKAKPIYNSQFEAKSADELLSAAVSAAAQPQTTGPAVPSEHKVSSSGAVATAVNEDGVAGPGWIIELKGHHYHNSDNAALAKDATKAFIIRTLINKMVNGEFELPGDEASGGGKFKYSDFGILLPTIVRRSSKAELQTITLDAVENQNKDNGSAPPSNGDGKGDANGDSKKDEQKSGQEGEGKSEAASQDAKTPNNNVFKANRYNFVVQFAWIPRTTSERIKAREARREREKAAATAPASDSSGAGAAAPLTEPPATNPQTPPSADPAGTNPAEPANTRPADTTTDPASNPAGTSGAPPSSDNSGQPGDNSGQPGGGTPPPPPNDGGTSETKSP